MPSQLAVQMYTVRDFTGTEKELADTLQKIAAIGYPAVQLSAVGAMNERDGAPQVGVETARQMLDDNGLACIATHRDWNRLAAATDDEIAFHHALNCPFIAIGGIPGSYGANGADGYRRFCADAQPVIARLKSAGIRFGFHNHAHEFARLVPGPNGTPQTLWDILIEEGGPDLCLETDVYWVWHAGVDPSALMRRSSGRSPVIHLKDKEVVAGDGPVMAPIGEGNLPWDTLLPACQAAGVEWYCVEQDTCRRDPFDCLASSFRFLTAKGL